MRRIDSYARNPQVHVLIVGSDEVCYGNRRGDGKTWRQWAFEKFDYDPSRIHFSPPLPYVEYVKVLQSSWVHIYWTIPFILSWSLVEAMSTECCIVASDTEPVKELVEAGKDGVLVDFFDAECLAAKVDQLLRNKEQRICLAKNARNKVIERGYSVDESKNRKILYRKC